MLYESLLNQDFCHIEFDAPLKALTTYKIGGNCKCVISVSSKEEILRAMSICSAENIPYFVVGNGSNILALDNGYSGVIININRYFGQVYMKNDRLYALAGASGKSVSDCAVVYGLSGAEFLATFPTTIGGAVYMNAGCFGYCASDIVNRVWCVDGIKEFVLTNAECKFGYRDSIFKHSNLIITQVEFNLIEAEQSAVVERVNELRYAKQKSQPTESLSAGCVFKSIENESVGQLVDKLHLKGFKIGGAEVSNRHGGFIINKGSATAEDVLNLIQIIYDRVKAEYGYDLKLEIKILGDEDDLGRLPYTYEIQPR